MDTKMLRESFGYTMSTVQEGAEATRKLAISRAGGHLRTLLRRRTRVTRRRSGLRPRRSRAAVGHHEELCDLTRLSGTGTAGPRVSLVPHSACSYPPTRQV